MPDITDDLVVVGKYPINDLFAFINEWNKVAYKNGDRIDQFMSMRTLLEVSEAIHLFARLKGEEDATN